LIAQVGKNLPLKHQKKAVRHNAIKSAPEEVKCKINNVNLVLLGNTKTMMTIV
jgi:hypothetical protein